MLCEWVCLPLFMHNMAAVLMEARRGCWILWNWSNKNNLNRYIDQLNRIEDLDVSQYNHSNWIFYKDAKSVH